MSLNIDLNYLFSGLIGAVIGILSSFCIVILKEYLDSKSCIQAITTELKCLNRLCTDTFDNCITDDETPLFLSYPLDTDYFSIFNANTSKIGKISDCFERELVVQIYMLAKYFIDCLKTNNECLSYFEKIEEKYKNNRNCTEHKEDIKFANDNLKHSKINNILPTYKKLKVLLETYLTMQNNKRWWQI